MSRDVGLQFVVDSPTMTTTITTMTPMRIIHICNI